mmetsp:Transcript_308/g.473  ORF Transcript_308/g.473 Transcript_308/m.473 type:complete len:313 (-) Transcript_308:411-1349(-)
MHHSCTVVVHCACPLARTSNATCFAAASEGNEVLNLWPVTPISGSSMSTMPPLFPVSRRAPRPRRVACVPRAAAAFQVSGGDGGVAQHGDEIVDADEVYPRIVHGPRTFRRGVIPPVHQEQLPGLKPLGGAHLLQRRHLVLHKHQARRRCSRRRQVSQHLCLRETRHSLRKYALGWNVQVAFLLHDGRGEARLFSGDDEHRACRALLGGDACLRNSWVDEVGLQPPLHVGCHPVIADLAVPAHHFCAVQLPSRHQTRQEPAPVCDDVLRGVPRKPLKEGAREERVLEACLDDGPYHFEPVQHAGHIGVARRG